MRTSIVKSAIPAGVLAQEIGITTGDFSRPQGGLPVTNIVSSPVPPAMVETSGAPPDSGQAWNPIGR
jgi:hypothetical protein